MKVIKNCYIIMVVMLIFTCSLNCVSAVNQSASPDQNGSITLAFNNSLSSQVTFSIYKIAEYDVETSKYASLFPFSNINFSVDTFQIATKYDSVRTKCLEIIETENVEPVQIQKGNQNGDVVFNNLSVGLYLIKQDKTLEKFNVESLLITTPLLSDNSLLYDGEVAPKYIGSVPLYPQQPPTESSKNPVVYIGTGDQYEILPIFMTFVISGLSLIILYFFIKNDRTRNSV